jgi:hypothetical protein
MSDTPAWRADPVKFFAAILWREEAALSAALEALADRVGPIDQRGPDRPFDATTYYEREMGRGLLRRLVSFEGLSASESLVLGKHAAVEIEDALRGPGGRRVNIDLGYLDVHKVVLASGKPGWQKIHVGGGVHADPTLRYSKGRFHPFPWSFADFARGLYEEELLRFRESYKRDLRARGVEGGFSSPDGSTGPAGPWGADPPPP